MMGARSDQSRYIPAQSETSFNLNWATRSAPTVVIRRGPVLCGKAVATQHFRRHNPPFHGGLR